MKIIFLQLFTALVFSNIAMAQSGLEKLDLYTRSLMDSIMNLKYSSQDGYRFESIEARYNVGLGVDPRYSLVSDDGHFIAQIRAIPPVISRYSPEDSIRLIKEGAIPERINPVDKEHVFSIRHLVARLYGEEEKNNWRSYARYLPVSEAKSKFNADTAIYVTLPEKKEGYIASYNHCTALFTQKKGRGYLIRYFLYDNEGQKNLDAHLAAMEGMFRYGDEAPLKKQLENSDMVTIRFPMFKKQRIVR